MAIIRVPTYYYQQHDADYSRDVPAEGFGGWKKADLPLSLEHTAVVVMHAWNCGAAEQFPGWHKAVEYIPRSYEIARNVFPPLLQAVRASSIRVFHVVSPADYYKSYPGYRDMQQTGESERKPFAAEEDEAATKLLRDFRWRHISPGEHNQSDAKRGYLQIDFLKEARPEGNESIIETSEQLAALCRTFGISHLIYIGFAINWCLEMSPGGMLDMSRNGLLCSTIRQAVTAVENRETAGTEICKSIALWKVSLAYGFVYDAADIIGSLTADQTDAGSV